METSLFISKAFFPPQSARGCQQLLKRIHTGQIERAINGEIVQFRGVKKLWTRIICTDRNIPSLLDLDIGQTVQIGCIQRLWRNVRHQKEILLKHRPFEGSVSAYDSRGQFLCDLESNQELDIPEQAYLISYRPWLSMVITHMEVHTEEWEMKAQWVLEAEEM